LTRKADERLSFRQPIKSDAHTNPESTKIYGEIKRKSGSIPKIYQVKALADNPIWLRLLNGTVFQWPQRCALDEKTKELVGLAKSIGHLWEPGILTNIEGAIEAGATSEEITETILLASIVLGLADLDHGLRAGHFETIKEDSTKTVTEADVSVQRVYDDSIATMERIPELYRFRILVENPDWLKLIHESAKIRYTRGVLEQKTKALICLAASAAKRWDRGIEEHLEYSLRSGATSREVADVLISTYKTAVSIGVQAGFSVPCSIPEMSGFKLLKDYYSESSAESRQKKGR